MGKEPGPNANLKPTLWKMLGGKCPKPFGKKKEIGGKKTPKGPIRPPQKGIPEMGPPRPKGRENSGPKTKGWGQKKGKPGGIDWPGPKESLGLVGGKGQKKPWGKAPPGGVGCPKVCVLAGGWSGPLGPRKKDRVGKNKGNCLCERKFGAGGKKNRGVVRPGVSFLGVGKKLGVPKRNFGPNFGEKAPPRPKRKVRSGPVGEKTRTPTPRTPNPKPPKVPGPPPQRFRKRARGEPSGPGNPPKSWGLKGASENGAPTQKNVGPGVGKPEKGGPHWPYGPVGPWEKKGKEIGPNVCLGLVAQMGNGSPQMGKCVFWFGFLGPKFGKCGEMKEIEEIGPQTLERKEKKWPWLGKKPDWLALGCVFGCCFVVF